MRIIPAIDIIDGKCVRLTLGDYSTEKVYSTRPLEVARRFEDSGIKYLHLVDLDGARSSHIVNYRILEELASLTNLSIDFGGGIKSENDLKIAFESGAHQVSGGSLAVDNPELFIEWIRKYGSDKIILGADSLDGKIQTSAWATNSGLGLQEHISNYSEKGISYVICTDINRDGMLKGPAITLYKNILSSIDIKLIASGGISSIKDLLRLKDIGCEGAIIGKAIYEGKIKLKELKDLC